MYAVQGAGGDDRSEKGGYSGMKIQDRVDAEHYYEE